MTRTLRNPSPLAKSTAFTNGNAALARLRRTLTLTEVVVSVAPVSYIFTRLRVVQIFGELDEAESFMSVCALPDRRVWR